MIDAFRRLLGREGKLDDLNWALRHYVGSFEAPVVGALHVTCADESECECSDAFQRYFVNLLLPDLKFAEKAPVRLSNLGGRYEWGALAVAEQHFATPPSRHAFKVLLVKINAHVGVIGTGAAARYGQIQRYDAESTACGTLHALLAGEQKPYVNDLRHAFLSEHHDRLSPLLDPHQVDPKFRGLLAAITSARLQARRVEQEIQQYQPTSPTVYVVAAGVTLNHAGRPDTELLVGVYVCDQRGGPHAGTYAGLGDDPTRYVVGHDADRLRVTDDQLRS